MTPALQTKYVFSLAIKIGAPIVAGDFGYGVRRIIPILGGDVRGEGINGTIFLSVRRGFPDHSPERLYRTGGEICF